MDPRKLLRPNGPLPPSVYWMRRAAIVFIGVGVIVLVGVLILRAIPGGSSTVSSQPPATRSTTPPATAVTTPPTTQAVVTSAPTTPTSPKATAATGSVPACAAADLTVTVASAESTYAAGTDPQFTVTVKATTPCRAAVGFVVTSGPERIWGSADCAGAAPTAISATYGHTVGWDLKRSVPGCATVFGTTTATAGTYHVVATVAGASSAPVRFLLS